MKINLLTSLNPLIKLAVCFNAMHIFKNFSTQISTLCISIQISKSDFTTYCRNSEMFASLDKNKDKVVSDIEVTSKAHLAFKALDRNHDGFISKKEFSKISKNLNSEQVDTNICDPFTSRDPFK